MNFRRQSAWAGRVCVYPIAASVLPSIVPTKGVEALSIRFLTQAHAK
jgi:hypothetical protein